jgi:predicted RNA-binding Zn ribbon-like protein
MKDVTPQVLGSRCCLALVNSVWWRRSEHPQDQLTGYGALAEIVAEAGWLPDRATLLARASVDATAARSALNRGVRLREAMFRIFSDVVAGTEPGRDDLAELEKAAAESSRHRSLRPAAGGFAQAGFELWWPDRELALPVWQAATSAVDLLTGPDLDRLKQCPGDRCGWVFVDGTRNRSRRWCDGRECGNRERVRAHYERTRRSRTGSPEPAGPPTR